MSRAARIYLNNAATAWPRAPGVSEAVCQTLDSTPQHPGRSVSRASNVVTECRSRLAKLLAVDDETRVVLTSHATHALNLAILGLGRVSQMLTTVTEHNSVLRPLRHVADKYDAAIDIVGLDGTGRIDAEAFRLALERGPGLVAINHVSNVTGRVNDVTTLFKEAKQVGAVTLLDASQSLGHIPVHPQDLSADLVAFTGHKGLRGPAGTGGLYVTPALELEQVFVGGTGVRSDLPLHPSDMPMRLEAGTPNVPALAGLAAALRWLDEDGGSCQKKEASLAGRLRAGLSALSGITVLGFHDGAERLGIVSFTIDGWDVDEAGYVLHESFGIVCRTGLHCAPLIHAAIGSAPRGTIRFSVSGFNSDADVDSALEAVSQLAR